MTVFCDNGDCCYIGEDGLCGCDKLSIVGGVCAGSYRSGRNACDGDVDERLKADNAKLRKLAVGMYGMLEMLDKMLGNHDACETTRPLIFGEDKSFKDVMRELGMELDG